MRKSGQGNTMKSLSVFLLFLLYMFTFMAQVWLGAYNPCWFYKLSFQWHVVHGQGIVLPQPLGDTVQGAEWQRKVLTELKAVLVTGWWTVTFIFSQGVNRAWKANMEDAAIN